MTFPSISTAVSGPGAAMTISGYRIFILRIVFATSFLSGLDVITEWGPFAPTHALLALTFGLMIVENLRVASSGLLDVFLSLILVSWIFVLATGPSFGEVESRMLQTVLPVALAVFMIAVYHNAFVMVGRNIRAFFNEYLRVAAFFAVVGLAQEAIFVATRINIFGFLPTGAKELGPYLGISGLSTEPAFYACALLPAASFYIVRLIRDFSVSWRTVATVGAVILSTSSVGYLGLATTALIAGIMAFGHLARRSAGRLSTLLLVLIPALVLGGYWLFQQPFFQLRLRDSLNLLELGADAAAGTNLSSYSLAVNSSIAFKSLADNFGLGAGFGMYGTVFQHYIDGFKIPSYRTSLPGAGSATSFFLRLTAELGVLGVALMVAMIIWFVIAMRRGAHTDIATALLGTFAVILLRMGEYFDNGVLFVVLMSYLLWQETRRHPVPLRAMGQNPLPATH